MSNKKYPLITDDKFNEKIANIYKSYTIPKNKQSINKYCKPKDFQLQQPQKFLSKFINPKTPYKSVLIYHRIGSGKTCSAIQIAEQWKGKRKIIFVLPASLKGNFMNELRGQCGGYLTSKEREQLKKLEPYDSKYQKIIDNSNERIREFYQIYSYNKFIEFVKNDEMTLNNSILFIDEIQNMISETGTYYNELYDLIYKSNNNVRIVLLSATPMFDRPVELALTLNLLRLPVQLPTGRDFDKMFIKETTKKDKTYFTVKNMDKFKQMIKGYVSYYKGAPEYTFPKMNIKYVECEMSEFQYNVYKKIIKNNDFIDLEPTKEILNFVDLPNDFYIGTRFASNVVFPNKKTNEVGFHSLTNDKIVESLSKYSCKLDKIIKNIKRSKGKVFLYSSFKGYAGLKTVVKVLEAFGYKDYNKHGVGRKRFALWSGDESTQIKEEIREIYNRDDNLYGEKLKIILGSPSIKEGVSLKAVRYVHILEPYWNISRLDQVIGRASRFCSHINLPEEERNVNVYVYISTYLDEPVTIDQYVKKISETKNSIIKQFDKAIKESAIDCKLNKNANQLDEEYECL